MRDKFREIKSFIQLKIFNQKDNNGNYYVEGHISEMDEIGFDDYVYGEGVSLIEWANLIEEILPAKRTQITIEKDLEKGFDYRRILVRHI